MLTRDATDVHYSYEDKDAPTQEQYQLVTEMIDDTSITEPALRRLRGHLLVEKDKVYRSKRTVVTFKRDEQAHPIDSYASSVREGNFGCPYGIRLQADPDPSGSTFSMKQVKIPKFPALQDVLDAGDPPAEASTYRTRDHLCHDVAYLGTVDANAPPERILQLLRDLSVRYPSVSRSVGSSSAAQMSTSASSAVITKDTCGRHATEAAVLERADKTTGSREVPTEQPNWDLSDIDEGSQDGNQSDYRSE